MKLRRSLLLLSTTLFVSGTQARLKRTRNKASSPPHKEKENEQRERTSSKLSECPVYTEISCNSLEDGKDCNEIMIQSGRCKQIKVEYQFKYCNTQPLHQKGHGTPISDIRGICSVNRGTLLEQVVQDGDLEPERCRILRHVVQLDSCAHVFQANIDLDIWMNDSVVCEAHDMKKIVRPLFKSSER